MTEPNGPYARCKTCGIDLATKDDQSAHMSETLNAARAATPDVLPIYGHSTTVINPTPDEIESRRVRSIIESAVESALSRCCEELDEEIRRGQVTEEQVNQELSYYGDFSDAWSEWINGNNS